MLDIRSYLATLGDIGLERTALEILANKLAADTDIHKAAAVDI